MKDVTDRVAVVTGAASGIGRALSLELARRGARLAISDVDAAGLAATREACEQAGARVLATVLDVADRDAVFAHAEQVEQHFGAVHLVINNAGVALAAMATEQTMDDLDRIIDVDWWGVAHGTQAFLPRLIASGDGALVNVSSVFGIVGIPGQSAYNAAKFAVRGYTEAIAQEAAMQDLPITVHCVHPGGILTSIARNAQTRGEFVGLADGFDALARTTPETCARTILDGVAKGRQRILVGADAWAIHLLQQVLGVRANAVLRRIATTLLDRSRARQLDDGTTTEVTEASADVG